TILAELHPFSVGHQLVEIRVRALKNILCKIDHGLITLVDLAQEKRLFVLLLEWFNFPNVPLQGDVLNLCNQLAKHSSGGQHFREIGALEFLSQLRPNVEPKIQVCIDEIVDNLFKLPDTPVDTQAIAYQLHPQMTMEQQGNPTNITSTTVIVLLFYFVLMNLFVHLVNNAVKCLKFSTFPWLTLTVTDRHILSSNETSLRSSNQTLVRSTCELLQDVIMQDFPAEIFLQRPKIVQNLLLLTKLAFGRDGTQHLALQAVGCLYQLCNYLRNRLNFHRDPSFFSAKNDLVSQNSSVTHAQETQGTRISQNPSPRSTSPRPSVIGRTVQRPRGDGQDGDAASSSGSSSQGHIHSRSPTSSHSVLDLAHVEMPKMENEDSVELQFQQLSLPQFCCLVLEHVISMLRTGSRKIVLCVLELLAEVVLLINYSISEDVWVDDSLTGRELRESLIAGLDALGESLAYHSSSINVDLPEAMLLHHRMTFISIALFTMQLLQVLVPVEKANEVLPESIEVVLYLLSLDISFRLAYPNVHETITAYLEQVSSESYTIYKRATEIVHSMEFACRFLKEIEDKDENNLLELIELADQAVTSLPYHQHLQLIQKYIEICSEIWKSAQASPLLQGESQKVLLKLLSHPLPAVKSEAYLCSLNIVKECLGIYNVTKPMPSVCQGVHFLLHGRVLYEICTFGLQDSLEQVNSAAKNILVYLLQGGLIMNTLTWSKLIEAFYPVIPILQGFADAEGPLGSCILALSETYNDAGDGVLPRKARLRAALRLLMCKKQSIRSIALKHLMWHLINEEGATDKQPSLQGSVLQYASNVYVLDESIDLHPEETSTSLFKGDNVFKVYEILISETVDLALRKSAAEQLVIMMQDNTMHGVLKNHGIIEKIISFVHESVHRNGKVHMQCLVLPCLAILRKLVYSDPTLRHSLAQETPFLLALFRVSLILQKEKSVLIEAAVLLSLLLFDEVATINFCIYSLDFMKCLRTYTSAEFVEKLKLSPIDGVMLKVTNVASGLQDCLSSITLAVSHITVSSALSRMRLYLLNDKLALKQGINSSLTVLQKLEWHTALGRFLQILPACTEDEKLLADVVSFLRKLLLAQKEGVDSKDLTSLLELLLRQESNPLLNFFVAAESPVQGEMDEIQTLLRQKLRKELTEFFNIVLQALTSVTDRKCLLLAGPFRTLLAVKFLQCLRITDAPHFYGLPSLERTLRGMVHITALPRWSLHSAALEPYSLCMKYLTGLLEVISAFYVEWGGNAMSYMGKGVTKSAVLCLLQLSHEMMTQANDETWVSLWSLAYEQNNEEQMPSRLGLAWLIPLWVDRDPEVRFASLGIGSALTLVENGCTALASSCQNISGGLWGTVLNILLDQSECSMVRREAASILQNLLMICLPANTEETKDVWQTPCVHDEESGVSLVGLPAFQALLYHCQFYEHVAYMAKHCYFGRQMFDFSVAKSTENSLLSNSFEDSLKYWRMPSVLSNHNQSSSPPSTSSTLVWKSDTDTLQSLDSENSHVSVNSEQCAVVTPHLLSAVCSLLTNLLAAIPEDTLIAVKQNHLFVTSAIYQTWTDLFILLNLILRKSGQATFPSVVGAAAEQWAALIDTISVCIQLSNSTPYLYTASLQFISLLLAEEGKRQFHNSGESQCPTITELLEISDGTEPSGICLCEILLQSYEGKSTEDAHRKVAAGALTSLLAVSGSAQKHALQAGVIDSSIEQMKHTCIQLKLDSLRPGKVVQRKKDDSLIQELKIAMQLLRNCLYNNAECKVAASDAHLVSVVHSLWPWFLMDDQLLLTALQLLCVYTANLSACEYNCGASLVPQCSQRSLSNNSLVHLIMKQALHKSCDNSMVRQMAFALLSNLAMFHECKGILQKSNFLQNFLAVPLPKTTVKGLSTLTTLWLKLLLNISFGDDGQQMILKMNGSLELLTTMSQYKHKGSQPTALLILHNICFSPANKPKVLANDNIVSTFAACLENDNPLVQTIGASALWALLHNYQKLDYLCHKSRNIHSKKTENTIDRARTYLDSCECSGCLLLDSPTGHF
uniref:Rotatin n=1 Tax=Callorhinchus milii TaxID=7868 RepID=A0A4W3H9B8_CALMI